MRRFLVSISLFVLSLSGMAQALEVTDSCASKYSVNISFHGMTITGLCIVRDYGDEVIGSVVNEFGIKAFDFVFNKDKGKTKLQNVIKMMNKWYIKKVIRADLSTLLCSKNSDKKMKRRTIINENGMLLLNNTKYNINYKFIPIDDTQQ